MSLFHSVADCFHRVLRNNEDGLSGGRRGIFFGTVAESAVTTMLTGIFYSALLTVLLTGADESTENHYLTLIETITTFIGLSQVFSPFLFESIRRRKKLILSLRGFYYFVQILVLPLITVLSVSVDTKALLFILSITLATVAESIGTPARSAWQLHSLPLSIRSDYYSCIRLSTMVINASLTFAMSLFMDFFTANNQIFTGILLLRGVALPLSVFVIRMFSKAEEPDYNTGIAKITVREIVTTPLKSRIFLVMVLINVLYTIGNGFQGQFYNYYLINQVKIGYTYISICQILAIPCTFLSLSFWNRQVQRRGWLPTLAVSMALFSVCHVLNAFVTPDTEYLYILSNVYCQLVNGGMVLAVSNLPFLHVPENMKAACLAFFNATSSLAGTFSRWMGGLFVTATEGISLRIFGITLQNRGYMCLINAAVLLADVILIAFVALWEKKKAP